MIKSEIQSYIQQQLAQGVSRAVITESLTTAGWPAQDIQDSFLDNNQSPSLNLNKPATVSIINETVYPIQFAWVWKSGVTFFMAVLFSIILLIFGYIHYYLILLILYSPIQFIILVLRRKNFHYELSQTLLNVKQGVINKQQRTIPYGVIQNVFVKQDLFDRIFGLSSLSIENASQAGGAKKMFGLTLSSSNKKEAETIGFDGNKISIPGLKKEHAEILKAAVLEKMKMNPIDDNRSGL